MKNFVKALLKNGAAFQHLSTVFPALSAAKLNFIPPNLGAVSDKHGERFHQDITKMEHYYQGKWNPGMMGDFCWMLLRNIPEAKYTRSSKKTHFWLSVVLWIV